MGIPAPTGKKHFTTKRLPEKENLSADEIKAWMKKEGFSEKEFSLLLGVTQQAVGLWLSGQREFSTTNSRLIKLFKKYPNLVREF